MVVNNRHKTNVINNFRSSEVCKNYNNQQKLNLLGVLFRHYCVVEICFKLFKYVDSFHNAKHYQ